MTTAEGELIGARRMWHVVEPYHDVVYFAPETREAYARAGLKGAWMGYFASRSAPMGAVGSEVVVAVFHNFAPAMVRRAIPDAWTFSTPERVLAARLEVAGAALKRLLGDALLDGPEVAEAATIAAAAVAASPPGGRPLFAAHAALPATGTPHLDLWLACSALREHRYEGHVMALTVHGLDGLEAHLLLVGSGALPREILQPSRGFDDAEWEAAAARLRERGWLDAGAALTPAGRAVHDAVEVQTDDLARAPWEAIGPEATARLHAVLAPRAERIAAGGGIPPVSVLAHSWAGPAA